MKFKCKKAIWKCTYKGWAFNLKKVYELSFEDDEHYWLIDNEGQEFSITKEDVWGYYWVDKHFKLVEE